MERLAILASKKAKEEEELMSCLFYNGSDPNNKIPHFGAVLSPEQLRLDRRPMRTVLGPLSTNKKRLSLKMHAPVMNAAQHNNSSLFDNDNTQIHSQGASTLRDCFPTN